jgi:hypothetical protein
MHCRAIFSNSGASIPNEPSRQKPSPLILSNTREYAIEVVEPLELAAAGLASGMARHYTDAVAAVSSAPPKLPPRFPFAASVHIVHAA